MPISSDLIFKSFIPTILKAMISNRNSWHSYSAHMCSAPRLKLPMLSTGNSIRSKKYSLRLHSSTPLQDLEARIILLYWLSPGTASNLSTIATSSTCFSDLNLYCRWAYPRRQPLRLVVSSVLLNYVKPRAEIQSDGQAAISLAKDKIEWKSLSLKNTAWNSGFYWTRSNLGPLYVCVPRSFPSWYLWRLESLFSPILFLLFIRQRPYREGSKNCGGLIFFCFASLLYI